MLPNRNALLRAALRAALLLVSALPAPLSAAPSAVDPGGFVSVSGRRIFPLGVYHLSTLGTPRTGNALVDDFYGIYAAGGRFVMPHLDSEAGDDRVLSAAARLGMVVMPEVHWDYRHRIIGILKSRPAVIGWNVADDVNWPKASPKFSPRQLAERAGSVKAIDPSKVTYATFLAEPGFELRSYLGKADVMAVQCYQAGFYWYEQHGTVHGCKQAWGRAVDEARGSATSVFAIPQLQASGPEGLRIPNPRQARAYVYAAAMEGVKGILGYNYYDGSGFIKNRAPATWHAFTAALRELRTLEVPLMHGERSEPATGEPYGGVTVWRYHTNRYVFVVNTHPRERRTFSADIGTDVGNINQPFARPSTWPARAGRVMTFTAEPEEVQIFRIG